MHWQSVFVLSICVCIICLSSLAMGHPHHSRGHRRKHVDSRADFNGQRSHHEKRGHRKRHLENNPTLQDGEDLLHENHRPGHGRRRHPNQQRFNVNDVSAHVSPNQADHHMDDIDSPTKPFPEMRDRPTKSNFALPSDLPMKVEAFRLEMIKEQILDKLRLKSPPTPQVHINHTDHLPPPLVEAEMGLSDAPIIAGNKNIRDFYAKTAALWVFGEEVSNCYNPEHPAACFKFHFKEKLKQQDITSATLWVYKERDPRDAKNQTLVVSQLNDPNRSSSRVKKIIDTKETSLKQGWVQFDIKDMVRKWTGKPHRNHGLQVSCKTCLKSLDQLPISLSGDSRPMIMITTSPEASRKKRSARNCNGNDWCCKQEFEVNFASIGWDNWIIRPLKYMANYCKGSCFGQITNDKNYHNMMLKFALQERPESNLRKAFTPCCTPTVMSGLSILYYDNDANIIQKNLPNMIVEECGCS